MAELTTIARPYAQAIFKRASETQRLQQWSDMLQYAAAVAEDEEMSKLTGSARFSKAQLRDLFLEVCGDKLDEEGRNLIKVLVDYRRLVILPHIAEVYEEYRAEAESTIEAQMVTAYPLAEDQANKIAETLSSRLGRRVNLTTETDQSLLGGAIIRAGDMVIDGSARAKLNKLAAALNQ